ncbi:MAG: MFS transporter [Dehalococcoidia bacterium]
MRVSERTTLYYGWWITAVAFVTNVFAWSTRASFSVLYVAMLHSTGWSRTQGVLGYALSWVLLAVFAPLAGWLYDRFGPRLVVPAGGISLALGIALTSLVHVPWQFYLSYGLLVGFGISATLSPSSALLSRWFVQRRGTVLGINAAGASLGTVVSLPLMAAVIAHTGWRTALLWYAVALLVGLVPLPALVYRRDPRDLGLKPDGRTQAHATMLPITSERDWRVRTAMRTLSFWAAFVMLMLGVIAFQVLTTHQVAHATDKGIAAGRAAFIFGLLGVYQFGGNLVGGWLSDRWGRQWVFACGSLLGVLATAVLASLSGPHEIWKLHVYAAAMGIGFGARISLLSAIPADIFGGPRFGLILGLLQAGSGIGGFIGPTLGGAVYDASGSYTVAFAVAGGAVLLSGVAAWFARPAVLHPVEQPISGSDAVKPPGHT